MIPAMALQCNLAGHLTPCMCVKMTCKTGVRRLERQISLHRPPPNPAPAVRGRCSVIVRRPSGMFDQHANKSVANNLVGEDSVERMPDSRIHPIWTVWAHVLSAGRALVAGGAAPACTASDREYQRARKPRACSESVEEVPRDIWQDRATPRETRAMTSSREEGAGPAAVRSRRQDG